ncbi:MAG: MFS transporter [Candidatus Pacearchaeota archaeon]|nr:MFS transporter [Candidatus Pacearchaeota archaeon]
MKKDGKKGIYLLGASSFFNDSGSEMIAPILPFYITSLGGTGLAVGLLSGLREGLSSIFKLIGGFYSDRIGKRMPIVFLGYFISVVCRFLLSLANFWQLALAFVSIERIGKSRDAPRDVLITKFTKKRGWGFGIHQMFDTLGAVVGSILILIFVLKFNFSYKTIILIAGTISSLSLIPLFFVKDKKTKPTKNRMFFNIQNINKHLKYLILVFIVFSIANFGLYMFMLLRAKEITGTIAGAIGLGVIFNMSWAILSPYFGKLSDKFGRKNIIFVGYLIFLFVVIGFLFASSILFLAILFFFYGVVYAITQGNQKAFVSDFITKNEGTIFGVYQFSIGIASIIGGTIAGILWDISPNLMFAYLSIVSLISLILFSFVKNK